jgi:competence protein ComEC
LSWWASAVGLVFVVITTFLFNRYWIVALAIVIGSASYSIHSATLTQSSIGSMALARKLVQIEAIVISDCKITRHKVYGSQLKKPSSSFLARTKLLDVDNSIIEVRVPVRILGKFNSCVDPGDVISIFGKLIITKEKRVAGTLIAEGEPKVIKPANKFANALTSIRFKFRNHARALGGDAGALIPGMILGDTTLQSENFSTQMRRAGLSHLTAVSGANFAIVSALVFFLFRGVIPRIIPRLIVTSLFLLVFLLLVRPSPSVLRAGVMAAVVLLSKATGNARNSVAALATAIAALLLLDPFQSLDPGFVLSVLATGGLIFIAPIMTKKLSKHFPEWLAEMIAIPCAATFTCTPYIIFLSGEVSVLSVLFNMLVAPVVAPITIIGFISVLLLPIPVLTNLLLLTTKPFAQWIVLISGLTNHVPSWGISPALLVVLMIATWVAYRRKSFLFAISLVLIFVFINLAPRLAFPGPAWRILQCDVGQGDALLVNLGGGAAILFDAGPDPNLLRRCLLSADVSNLPLVVLSHGHADHYFGFNELSSLVDIGKIWSNGSEVINQITSNRAISVEQGFQARIGDVEIDVLWPAAHSNNFSTLSGDGSAENNRSLVLLVTFDGVKLLITGDIEPEVQGLLAQRYDLTDIDVMKVPHHGSRFQDSSFIEEVSPEVSLVSVGVGNTYGHPSAEVLEGLYEMGSRALRTDHDGPVAVAWRFDDSAQRYIFTIKSMRKEWWRIQWR